MPTKFKTWYERIGQHKGTKFTLPSLANQDSEKEVNINCMIAKYGLKTLMQKLKPDEEMYVDMTMFEGMTLNDIVKTKDRMKEYYEQMPSKVRKSFGDNFDNFYEKFKSGEFEDFVNKGILTQETVNEINRVQEEQKNKYINELTNTYKLQEKARLLAQKELEDEGKSENS